MEINAFTSIQLISPSPISFLISVPVSFMIMMPIMVIITVVMMVMMIVFVITLLIDCGCVTDVKIFHPLNSLSVELKIKAPSLWRGVVYVTHRDCVCSLKIKVDFFLQIMF